MEYDAVDVTPPLAILQISDARRGVMGIRRLDATQDSGLTALPGSGTRPGGRSRRRLTSSLLEAKYPSHHTVSRST